MPIDDTDRINVVLEEEDRQLLQAIQDELRLGARGRSAAVRYAIRAGAEKLGIPTTSATKRRTQKKDRARP